VSAWDEHYPWRLSDIEKWVVIIDVRLWHFSDIQPALTNVRFEGNNGHDANGPSCPLMTQSGHSGHANKVPGPQPTQ
jgi:hypothetical protein